MALTDIQTVRLKTGDRNVFQRQEEQGDGTTTLFLLSAHPILGTPVARVSVAGSIKTPVTDYTLDLSTGELVFTVAPTSGAAIQIDYTSVVFSDEEIQAFLDAASGGAFLASAYLLMAWAVDAARLSMKETRDGGSGFGRVTMDTSVRAREMRLNAAAYLDLHNKTVGLEVAADGFTEVPWTEMQEQRYLVTHAVRDLFDLNPLA